MNDSCDKVLAAPGLKVRISADRQRITHCAATWSATYTPQDLPRWLAFYERMAGLHPYPAYRAHVEVLSQAQDALATG